MSIIVRFVPKPRFHVEFTCEACKIDVIAFVHYGPATLCAECKWWLDATGSPIRPDST